ncbi:MAG: hypothetical protein HPY84_08120 [Syntrophobacteraceae bacterium]|nr:hypothetical protein [Syntrophobacteraceae bacterium]
MTEEHESLLNYTIAHFQEIARQNRFSENSLFEHDSSRCVICNPDLLPQPAQATYLKVAAESIKVRRPALDQGLVEEINRDLELMRLAPTVTLQALLSGDRHACECWARWVRDALETALGLLSVHSCTSRELDLDEADTEGMQNYVEGHIRRIMRFQLENADFP